MTLFVVMTVVISFMSSIASAESWVLWSEKEITETKLKNNTFWKIIDAYPDHKQCLQAMKRVWQVNRNQALEEKKKYDTFSRVEDVPYNLIITIFKDPKEFLGISEKFSCLPGTIDPREKNKKLWILKNLNILLLLGHRL